MYFLNYCFIFIESDLCLLSFLDMFVSLLSVAKSHVFKRNLHFLVSFCFVDLQRQTTQYLLPSTHNEEGRMPGVLENVGPNHSRASFLWHGRQRHCSQW